MLLGKINHKRLFAFSLCFFWSLLKALCTIWIHLLVYVWLHFKHTDLFSPCTIFIFWSQLRARVGSLWYLLQVCVCILKVCRFDFHLFDPMLIEEKIGVPFLASFEYFWLHNILQNIQGFRFFGLIGFLQCLLFSCNMQVGCTLSQLALNLLSYLSPYAFCVRILKPRLQWLMTCGEQVWTPRFITISIQSVLRVFFS